MVDTPLIPDILNAAGISYKTPHNSTVQATMLAQYENAQSVLLSIFENDVLLGSFTLDGWSKHQRQFNGVTFHYLDREFRSQSFAIGLEEYFVSASGTFLMDQVGMYLDSMQVIMTACKNCLPRSFFFFCVFNL